MKPTMFLAAVAALLLPSALLFLNTPQACAADKPASKPAKVVIKPGVLAKGDMDELVAQIKASVKGWLEDGSEDNDLVNLLNSISYDENTIDPLITALRAAKQEREPVNVYVINKLLQPLMGDKRSKAHPKKELYGKILPTIKDFKVLIHYNEFPVLKPDKLAELQVPETLPPKTTPEEAKRRVENAERARDAKQAKELPLALYNGQAAAFLDYSCRIAIACQDPKEDQAVIALLPELEKSRLATLNYVLDAIYQEIPQMSQEQAKRYYDELLKLGEQYRFAVDTFRDPAGATVNRVGNSTWGQPSIFIGASFLNKVNELAPTAKLQAVKVPSNDEVWAEKKRADDAAKLKKPTGK